MMSNQELQNLDDGLAEEFTGTSLQLAENSSIYSPSSKADPQNDLISKFTQFINAFQKCCKHPLKVSAEDCCLKY